MICYPNTFPLNFYYNINERMVETSRQDYFEVIMWELDNLSLSREIEDNVKLINHIPYEQFIESMYLDETNNEGINLFRTKLI